MSIRKWTALLLAMAMTLALASCGKTAAPDRNAAESAAASASASASVSAESSSEGSQSAPDEEPESAAVTVVFNDVDASSFAEDDVMLLDCTYQTATVTAADAAVQEKIQKDLDKVTEDLMAVREDYLSMSADEYAYTTQEEPEGYAMVDEEGNYMPYYLHLEGTVTRSDEAVLSILFAEDTYAHGAHGGHVLFTCNYDVRTGERLTFEMLGEDFRSTAEALVLARADEMEAEAISNGEGGLFFPDYDEIIPFVVLDGSEKLGDLWGDLFEGEEAEKTAAATTYFTDTAVVFISTEYTMQSYAAGTIEFEIPYAEFDGVMNADYLPQ